MNEEKEDLRRQVERLQGQITNLTNQVTETCIIYYCRCGMIEKLESFLFFDEYMQLTYCVSLITQLHQAQNECQRERTERCKLERLQMQHHKQVLAPSEVLAP